MAYRLANELQTGSDRDLVVGGKDGERGNAGSTITAPGAGAERAAGGGGGGGTGGALGIKMDEDEERDAVFYRLEMLGYRVGQGLVER